MASVRRTVHSSSAPRAEESSRKESLCSSCHRRPIRPRSVFYVSAAWPNAVSVGFREIRVPGSRVKIGARWKSHSVVDRTSVPAGALKARSGELCSRECGSVHSGFPKRCTAEIRIRKVGTLYIRAVETNAPKVGVAEIGIEQPRPIEHGVDQHGATKACAVLDLSAAKVSLANRVSPQQFLGSGWRRIARRRLRWLAAFHAAIVRPPESRRNVVFERLSLWLLHAPLKPRKPIRQLPMGHVDV
jgi:hypothetical protein